MQISAETNLLDEVGVEQIVHMFDLLPDTLFWIKNKSGQIIYANQRMIETVGQHCLDKLYGKTDMDFYPPHIAKQYMMDDEKVMKGELITNRIELNFTPSGDFAWFSTTKRPLVDSNSQIIGSYGFTKFLEETSNELSTVSAIKGPVDFIRQNYHNDICIDELAKHAFLSVSALERRFKKYLSKTPKQFINEVRLENARRLLIETQLPIMDIAFQCGFAEHSYFSKQFKSLFGVLPSQLRKQILDAKHQNGPMNQPLLNI